MTPSARAIVLHCSDFPLIHPLVHFLKDEGYRDAYDDLAIVGGPKNLADSYDVRDQDFVYRQILSAKKFHGVTEIILVAHTDCSAYGGHRDFASPAEERARHEKDLLRAQEMLQERFSEESLTFLLVLGEVQQDGAIAFHTLTENGY